MIVRTKLVGVSFEGRQDNIKQVTDGLRLFWEHEPNNIYDANAIHVYADPNKEISLGHLSKEIAAKFVQWIAAGEDLSILCTQVTGGKTAHQSFGVNVEIHRVKHEVQ